MQDVFIKQVIYKLSQIEEAEVVTSEDDQATSSS